MRVDIEPWHPSHDPQKFQRTDPTGRWYKLVEPDTIPRWLVMFWVLVALFVVSSIWWRW